jgi:hypothetical protein
MRIKMFFLVCMSLPALMATGLSGWLLSRAIAQ